MTLFYWLKISIGLFAAERISRPLWKRGDFFKSHSRAPATLPIFWRRRRMLRWM